MTTGLRSAWTVEPFRIGAPEEFARLRALFALAGYTEPRLCEQADVPSIHFFPRADERTVLLTVGDAQSLFVRLFVDGEHVPREVVRQFLSPEDVSLLESLEIVHAPRGHPELCAAKVCIYPIEELYIASDRLTHFDTTDAGAPADLVFPSVAPETYRFLRLMPRQRSERLLELCSGTGVAALIAARRFAGLATAIDITERSTRFAAFNAALNGITNAELMQGDLYEPVSGQTFDLIIAHPPYVPALEPVYVFRDAGEDGEAITRRVLNGLPTYLRPGGQFFCDCMMTEREGAPLEARIREMLGAQEGEFDVVIAQRRILEPMHYIIDQVCAGRMGFETVERWHDTFKRLALEQLVMCAVLIQRRDTPRPVVTTRRLLSELTSAADFQWVLGFLVETAGWDEGQQRQLLASRPRLLPRTELRSRSLVRDGQWSVEECALVTLAPFAVEASCPTWYATFLQWCDGRMTVREHLQYLRDTKVVPDSAPEDLFAGMIRQLVDAGLVEIDEFRLPDATAMREATVERPAGGPRPRIERAD